jgi:hypothetical protein
MTLDLYVNFTVRLTTLQFLNRDLALEFFSV